MSLEFPEHTLRQFHEIAARYPDRRAAVIEALHLAQKEFGYVNTEVERYVAQLLDLPPTHVRQVSTFYGMFHEQPVGKYHLKVCESISCHLMGAISVLDYLQRKLGIKVGETTPDGKFTLSTVECLGACEMAPMMQVNDDFHGPLDEEKIDRLLNTLE